MTRQLVRLAGETLDAMDTELGLSFSIADTLAEVKHRLILANIFDILFHVAKLVQAHFKIIEEVTHRVLEEIELVDVMLVEGNSINFVPSLRLLLKSLVENFF